MLEARLFRHRELTNVAGVSLGPRRSAGASSEGVTTVAANQRVDALTKLELICHGTKHRSDLAPGPGLGVTAATVAVADALSILISSSMITVICSGGLRWALDSDGGTSTMCTENACSPLRPSTTPNSTRWPAFKLVTPGGNALART